MTLTGAEYFFFLTVTISVSLFFAFRIIMYIIGARAISATEYNAWRAELGNIRNEIHELKELVKSLQTDSRVTKSFLKTNQRQWAEIQTQLQDKFPDLFP